MHIKIHKRFKKDVERVHKRGKDPEKLKQVMKKLAEGTQLEGSYKLHRLKGKFQGFYECHLDDDWLLIYEIDTKNKTLTLIRTGSHDDLGV